MQYLGIILTVLTSLGFALQATLIKLTNHVIPLSEALIFTVGV